MSVVTSYKTKSNNFVHASYFIDEETKKQASVVPRLEQHVTRSVVLEHKGLPALSPVLLHGLVPMPTPVFPQSLLPTYGNHFILFSLHKAEDSHQDYIILEVSSCLFLKYRT